MTDLGIAGTVARFKPVHKGHAAVLEALCERAEHVYIGLGSCNKYDVRNPFTAKESAEMIDLVLKPQYSNYSFIEVHDLGHGPRWREQAIRLFGTLDHFVTGNDYVESLLKDVYKVVNSLTVVPEDKRCPVNGTMVRLAIARSEPWEHLVLDSVAVYIKEHGLVDRFCHEFGLETLATHAFAGDVK